MHNRFGRGSQIVGSITAGAKFFSDHKRAMYDEHLQLDKELVHQGYLFNERN